MQKTNDFLDGYGWGTVETLERVTPVLEANKSAFESIRALSNEQEKQLIQREKLLKLVTLGFCIQSLVIIGFVLHIF